MLVLVTGFMTACILQGVNVLRQLLCPRVLYNSASLSLFVPDIIEYKHIYISPRVLHDSALSSFCVPDIIEYEHIYFSLRVLHDSASL